MSLRAARFAVALCVGGINLLGACSKPPSHDECDALLDHYVELLVNSDRPGTSAGELHKLQIQARQKAVTDPEFAECNKRVSRRAYECAMSAANPDKLEQCLL
jgi:hypothetical protein